MNISLWWNKSNKELCILISKFYITEVEMYSTVTNVSTSHKLCHAPTAQQSSSRYDDSHNALLNYHHAPNVNALFRCVKQSEKLPGSAST